MERNPTDPSVVLIYLRGRLAPKYRQLNTYDMPTMMLLIGMNISLTKKPMNPMIAKPTDVACAIFENSASRGTNSASAPAGMHARSQPLH